MGHRARGNGLTLGCVEERTLREQERRHPRGGLVTRVRIGGVQPSPSPTSTSARVFDTLEPC